MGSGNYQLKCIFLLFFLSLTSCEQYRTPLPNDPFYRKHSVKIKKLKETGNKYSQRSDYYQDSSSYQPAENENYDEYRARVMNTLIIQQHDQKALDKSIESKTKSLDFLEEQALGIQSQHIALRLRLARLTGQMNESSDEDMLFSRYTIMEGDTLQKLAYQTYGFYNGWLAIYRFNIDQLPYGPDRIRIGQEILIPRVKNIFMFR